jgi:hypothetical protein
LTATSCAEAAAVPHNSADSAKTNRVGNNIEVSLVVGCGPKSAAVD